ncbi:MAG: hypothetical protein M9930_19570 [Anaerolineae bacterium]|nr:hypothetical protein [Anaerolineae bacterium]
MYKCFKRDHENIGIAGNGNLNGGRDSSCNLYTGIITHPNGAFCRKARMLLVYLIEKLNKTLAITILTSSRAAAHWRRA